MIATVVRRGRTQKTVKVDQIAPDTDDISVALAACGAANESTAGLFGWKVERTTDSVATVTLYTD